MNKNQGKGHTSEGKRKEFSGKVADNETPKHQGKADKHGGKTGAVLGEVNDDPKKATKSTKKEMK
ncbi:hypothetical protein ABC977_10795 [Thioalkalicoccus limnaeus]|uniref:Stress-induced protein n=1 Tax=Thioalkalicoccus limnaeus TaxID=120681 RepID=A0ABV4BED9_9GAMM